MNETDYGKHPNTPVLMTSIPASLLFMENLVTEDGMPVMYHRLGHLRNDSGQIIDHYKIMSADLNYEDIFIFVYAEKSIWIPPSKYLFARTARELESILMANEGIDKLDEEDRIQFERKYIFKKK